RDEHALWRHRLQYVACGCAPGAGVVAGRAQLLVHRRPVVGGGRKGRGEQETQGKDRRTQDSSHLPLLYGDTIGAGTETRKQFVEGDADYGDDSTHHTGGGSGGGGHGRRAERLRAATGQGGKREVLPARPRSHLFRG